MVTTSMRTNPFPGLRPFDLDEEHLFFGREGQADELLVRLQRNRFLAVVGTSGSGKSSLVRAGLLPALYSGFLAEASSSWRIAIMRPGDAPIRNLAEALNHPDVLGVEGDDAPMRTMITETTLRRGAPGLIEVVRQARLPAADSLLVVVDQFEELFRFKQRSSNATANDEAAAFVKLLLSAIHQTGVPIYVVLTMRSDFLGDCAQFRDLPEAINDSQYLIPRMTRDQRRAAIEGPVAVGEAEISTRLVNRLLNDVGDNPDQLPILQHALMRTWDHWEDHHESVEPIDLGHYEAIGGMAQALSLHADEIYDGLDDRSQRIAEKLFKCLTERGADNREIRRPTKLSEACAVAEAELEAVIEVIEAFRGEEASFLMPPVGTVLMPETMVDISHESLMRVWQRLKDWVTAEAEAAQIYWRLADTAIRYQVGTAAYLQDPELTIDLNWYRENRPNGAWAERYHPEFGEAIAFLEASVEHRDAELAEAERVLARQRELKRLRWAVATLGMFVLVIASTTIAYIQREKANELYQRAGDLKQRAKDAEKRVKELDQKAKDAEKEAREAEREREKAAEKLKILKSETHGQDNTRRQRIKDQTIALQQRSAVAKKKREKARRLRASAVKLGQQVAQGRPPTLSASVSFSNPPQDRKTEAPSEDIGPETEPVRGPGEGPGEGIEALPPSPEPVVVHSCKERNCLESHGASVKSVTFSPDGQFIASASDDKTIKLWDLQGTLLNTLEGPNGHGKAVNSVSFSPNGETIASASKGKTVKLWDLQGNLLKTLERPNGHSKAVNSVSFSPNGEILASASKDKTVKLWDLEGTLLQTLKGPNGHGKAVNSVSFSPNGEILASASKDKTVKLWDLQGTLLNTLEGPNGHGKAVNSVSFSPNGEILASASKDKTVKLWDLEGTLLRTLKGPNGHSKAVNSVSFSPDGETITSAGDDDTIILWNFDCSRCSEYYKCTIGGSL